MTEKGSKILKGNLVKNIIQTNKSDFFLLELCAVSLYAPGAKCNFCKTKQNVERGKPSVPFLSSQFNVETLPVCIETSHWSL